MRASGLLALLIVGCGGATPRATAPAPAAVEPEAIPVAPAPRRAEAELLIDGVRDAALLDELDGWRLVGGAGTVALVGPDGHVRASHRFGYGGDGANAHFLGPHTAIVGNGDYDGFRGPWSGRLVRWDLEADTIEQLAELGYTTPTMGQLGEHHLVGLGEGTAGVVDVTASGLTPVSSEANVLCLATERVCFTYGYTLEEVVRLDEAGELRTEPAPPDLVPVGATGFAFRDDGSELVRLSDMTAVRLALAPDEHFERTGPRAGHEVVLVRSEDGRTRLLLVPELTFHPADRPLLPIETAVAARGALGIPDVELAPSSARIALGSSAGTVVLGPAGVERSFAMTGGLQWGTDALLFVGGRAVPFDLTVTAAGSTWTDATAFVGGYDEAEVLFEAEALREWVGREGEGTPPDVPPVCNEATRRCVRTVLDGRSDYGVEAWEVYDPARPRRVLARFTASVPAVPRTALPTERWVRVIDAEGLMHVEPIGAGERSPFAEPWTWRETRRGWVLRPIDEPNRLVGVPAAGGALIERDFGDDVQVERLTIVDDERVLAEADGVVHVLRVPTLETLATYPLGGPRVEWECELADVVDRRADVRIEGACPRPLAEDDARTIPASLSFDRGLWAEPLGDVVVLHRAADGATLEVQMTTEGVLAIGPGDVFEATGTIADHLVLREAGPVRSATIATGADVRARERPGLVAAFFSGQPLPTR